MTKYVAIILGHPAAQDTFCHALAKAYEAGAQEAGFKTDIIALSDMELPFLTHKSDYKEHVPQAARDAQAILQAADHLVYPLWLGTMPAKMKAFLEWVLAPGFAYEYDDKGMPHKKLQEKSARIIVTMGMPGFVYRFFFMAHSLKALERNILKFVGMRPVRHSIFGMVEGVSKVKRQKWLDRVKVLGRKGR